MSNEARKIRIGGYALDPAMERDGVRIVMGKNPDGSEQWVHLFPLNSARYEDRLNSRRKQSSAAMLRNHPEIDARYQRETMAEMVFAGCGGFLDDAGQPIEDTYENRLAMLEDRHFFVDIVTTAASRETFRKWERAEEAQGNSQRSSSGS